MSNMPAVFPTDIEKDNLEAHVELCWERYRRLEEKIREVDNKVDHLTDDIRSMREEYMKEIREMREESTKDNRALKAAVMTSSATVIAALLGFITLFLKLHL